MPRRKPKLGGARPGAGRKPAGETALTVARTVKLAPAEAAAQDAAAEREGQTWPAWIRGAAKRRLAEE